MANDITAHLDAWRHGDRHALDAVMPGLYPKLRDIAAQRLAREHGALTLEPTDLVHEALARVLAADKTFGNRLHFLAVGALYMRSILIDRARAIQAGRRPGAGLAVTLGHADAVHDGGALDLLLLEDALQALEAEDARAARVIELSIFSGMPREDIAQLLGNSIATVDRDLRFARAWLNRALA